jgi:type III restriction enzyme
MGRKTKSDAAPIFDVKTTTAPCVPAIRGKVNAWRAAGYNGSSNTTRRLLHYWFHTDHRLPGGRKFAYHYSQQYAIETLVYLYEIARIRRQKGLVESFATRQDLKLLQHDDFARYCIKMATGSGKTKVIALAIAWQYLNAVAEGHADYAQCFLLLAPNVIVYERLRADFAGGRIFHLDPVIPNDLRIHWDFDCYMRGERERASSLGGLYVTNIHQLYDRPEPDADEPEVMTAMLGPKPPTQRMEVEDFLSRIVTRATPVVVLSKS